jgi:hypothetical protein
MQVTLSLPTSDTRLLQWSQNVVDLITPTPATWGLVTLDVTNYTAKHDAFADSVAACDPTVRNKTAVAQKKVNRDALKLAAQVVANKIYATPTVTDPMKVNIGMPPRQSPSPIPAPSTKPVIEVSSVSGFTATVRLRDAEGASRGKPAGTSGAAVLSYSGPAPAPTDPTKWTFQGIVGKVNKINVTFPDTLANGTQVYLTAFWFNGRKQNGPASDPVALIIQGGGVSLVA